MNKKRLWKIAKITILALAGLVAAFFLLFVPWFFTRIVTSHRYHFPDHNDGKTPQSFGMDYQPIAFRSKDGILLKGWFVPASSRTRGTIVLCHGMNRTRVEMLPMAAYAHSLGFNALLFDFRHEGQSGGQVTTIGFQERLDVEGAVQEAIGPLGAKPPVIVWGVSMGAAAALMAAADSPAIDAVISDSAWTTFHELIAHHAKLFMRLPSFPIADEIEYGIALRGHFWPSQFNLLTAVREIGARPILFVAVQNDRRMPPAYAETLYQASSSPQKALVVVPGSRHGEGFNTGREPYEAAAGEFLDEVAPPVTKADSQRRPAAQPSKGARHSSQNAP
jgi:fermentation-respiration switch protein FrsA (DUF1100 family)